MKRNITVELPDKEAEVDFLCNHEYNEVVVTLKIADGKLEISVKDFLYPDDSSLWNKSDFTVHLSEKWEDA